MPSFLSPRSPRGLKESDVTEGNTHPFSNSSTGHFAAEDVASRVKSLNDNMESLQARASRRRNDLEANVQFQQYLADLNEAEAWIQEKEPIVDNTNYGADEEAAGVRGHGGRHCLVLTKWYRIRL